MIKRTLTLLPCIGLAMAACTPGEPEPVNVVIVNARVIDGSGLPSRDVNVRIVGDRIATVGAFEPSAEDTLVDANGLVLAPGFIDVHSHHDYLLFEMPDALAAVSQGITTIVAGQDGSQQYPLAEFFAELGTSPVAVNVASYAGHGTLRGEVMGEDYQRHATPEEVAEMAGLLRGELDAGALGLSSGLEYDPGSFSATEEVVELARVAAAHGGRYISHIRSEDRYFWEAIIEIGREADLPVQVTHIKLDFLPEPAYNGLTIAEIAEIRGSDPETTLMELLKADTEAGGESPMLGVDVPGPACAFPGDREGLGQWRTRVRRRRDHREPARHAGSSDRFLSLTDTRGPLAGPTAEAGSRPLLKGATREPCRSLQAAALGLECDLERSHSLFETADPRDTDDRPRDDRVGQHREDHTRPSSGWLTPRRQLTPQNRQPSASMNRSRLVDSIPKCLQISGMPTELGLGCSSVTTTPFATEALAITNGSALRPPLRIFFNSMLDWKCGNSKIRRTNRASSAVGAENKSSLRLSQRLCSSKPKSSSSRRTSRVEMIFPLETSPSNLSHKLGKRPR